MDFQMDLDAAAASRVFTAHFGRFALTLLRAVAGLMAMVARHACRS